MNPREKCSMATSARKIHQLQTTTLTQSLTVFKNISELKFIHAQIITSGLVNNLVILSRLLTFSALSNSGDLKYAKTLFHHTPHPNLTMYNTMIRAISQSQHPLDSFQLYNQMLRSNISPDNFTLPFLIKSCSLSSLHLGQQLHSHVIKLGLDADVFVVNNTIGMYSSCRMLDNARKMFDECFSLVDVVSWTTLVTGYSSSGRADLAQELFDEMPCKNIVSWNAMITGYMRAGNVNAARRLFDVMPERNAGSWSAMISGYLHCGIPSGASYLFNEMWFRGITPNASALVSVISACAKIRDLEQGMSVHDYIKEKKIQVDVNLGTALVEMYGKCGDVVKAFQVFKEMLVKNIMTWNNMIAGLALSGLGKQALVFFYKMKLIGPPPNSVTFIALLSACGHRGLVDEGRRIFDIMTQEYEITPEAEHYGCMVDLLGRAGLIKEALDFVMRMPVKPHPGLWGALVGACRIHEDVELGQELGELLIELEPNNSGRYTLLSNLLAAANRWDDAALVCDLLKQRNVLKSPGCSIVET